MEPGTQIWPDLQGAPTASVATQAPQGGVVVPASVRTSEYTQLPLWHCDGSLHGAPFASDPWKMHSVSPRLPFPQPVAPRAFAHASSPELVIPLPGSTSRFWQSASNRARMRLTSSAGG